MIKALGHAANHSFSRLKPLAFERADAVSNEIQIDILNCGVCHFDINQVKNDWANTAYMMDIASLKREMEAT